MLKVKAKTIFVFRLYFYERYPLSHEAAAHHGYHNQSDKEEPGCPEFT